MAKAGIPCQRNLDDPKAFLEEHGWTATITQVGEENANYGRWPYSVASGSLPYIPRWLFALVVAQKKDF